MAEGTTDKTDTSMISEWRSIVTLVVFVLTNLNVLFPFHIPLYLPRQISDAILNTLIYTRIIPSRWKSPAATGPGGKPKPFVRLNFPMNFVTAPLIADLFLLAISAIGRDEVRGGTIGADHISPIDIMLFFITLAYIAISIDASGLIRWLAYRVLLWGGKSGYRLFFYLYTFFALLGGFIGNDPIILSGTPFLAYMTRVSSNIRHPRAWIFTQFAVANIVSAVLVSSNPTNLVLAGAFQIRFIDYTVNMIVPVVVTVVVLFPLLLWVIFRKEKLIPKVITMHELPEERRAEPPKNPCVPYSRGAAGGEEDGLIAADEEEIKLLELAEIMHPYLDKKGAAFGSFIMAATLIIVLALNAANPMGDDGELSVFWITLPAAVVMFAWDLGNGWLERMESRQMARDGKRELERALAERNGTGEIGGSTVEKQSPPQEAFDDHAAPSAPPKIPSLPLDHSVSSTMSTVYAEKGSSITLRPPHPDSPKPGPAEPEKKLAFEARPLDSATEKATLVSIVRDAWTWSRETFPTATFVLAHLPLALIPFAFTMFVLVQALVTKGWVPVFAHGWNHWVNLTGTVGAIGGMAFISVLFCNFAGTNIGTTILLCRIIQSWQAIHEKSGEPLSDRTFWATVYSMALGVNYGAFSVAFSASLAGLLWRDILSRKRIHVRARDFARYNVPIIAVAMIVGCAVLVGQIYIMRGEEPYSTA